MKLIESKTLATAAAQIEFTSIPQTYTDLVLKYSLRSSARTSPASEYYEDIDITFNGESARTFRGLYAINTTPASGSLTTFNIVGFSNGYASTSNTFSNGEIYIPNYTTTGVKSLSNDAIAENNSGSQFSLTIAANTITNSAAVTTITIFMPFSAGSNFVSGSMISLYGILKGSDGIVTTSP